MLDEVVFFDTMRQGLWVAFVISLPILVAALVSGVSIGLV
ncbi:MAG: flagellar biosynthetic protein FliQ, partial [Sulfitobacter sp.]